MRGLCYRVKNKETACGLFFHVPSLHGRDGVLDLLDVMIEYDAIKGFWIHAYTFA